MKNNITVALKVEKSEVNKIFLKNEYAILHYIQTFIRNNLNLKDESCICFPKVYEFFETSERNFFSMEYVGQNLFEHIKTLDINGALNIREKVKLLLQMLNCIETLHILGFLHLDIKPQNFAIYNNKIFLIDFGLARSFTDKDVKRGILNLVSDSKSFIGTLKYSSLNCHTRKYPLSPSDDIWSFFFMMIELLNVKLPWNVFIKKSLKTHEEIEVNFTITLENNIWNKGDFYRKVRNCPILTTASLL